MKEKKKRFVWDLVLLPLSLLVILTACSGGISNTNNTTGNPPDNSPSNGSGVVFASVIAKDASGQNLGYYLGDQRPDYSLLIYSPSGYMYWINWSGALSQEDWIFFSTDNCTGTPYVESGNNSNRFGKVVIYDEQHNKLYRLKSSLITSGGYITPTQITYKSYYDYEGTCRNDLPYVLSAIELEETTRAAVGIPETITPPITLNFQ